MEELIIQKYLNNPESTLASLAEEFNITYGKIWWIFHKHQIKVDRYRYSRSITKLQDSDLETIKHLYLVDKLRIEDIRKIYKVSRPTMDDFFKKHKIPTRRRRDYNKYSIDHN